MDWLPLGLLRCVGNVLLTTPAAVEFATCCGNLKIYISWKSYFQGSSRYLLGNFTHLWSNYGVLVGIMGDFLGNHQIRNASNKH
jgi:hypothetical protein